MLITRVLLAAAITSLAVPPPITVEADSTGRWHISVEAGLASYEAKRFGCSGNITDTAPVDMSSYGARLDYDLNDLVTLTIHGGVISTPDHEFADEGYYDDDDIDYFDGLFGGFQFMRDEESTGFGLGFVHAAGHHALTSVAAHMRIGRRDGIYFRGELMPAAPAFGATGWVRLGAGHGMGRQRQVGWFAGASLEPYTYGESLEPRFFTDLRLPVVGGFDLLLGGQIGHGEDQVQWSTTAGVRWTP